MDSIQRLRPEVRNLTRRAFHLERDVRQMEAVHAAGAAEAVILYASRVLEATAAEAMECLGLRAKTNVYGMLAELEDLGVLHEFDGYVGHALRRLGNGIRHIDYAPGDEDADIVVGLLDDWLRWFFVRFPWGARLPSLTEGDASWLAPAHAEVPRLLQALARFVGGTDPLDPDTAKALGARGRSRRPGHRALVCLAIEALIGRGEHEEAGALLEPGLRDAPDDVRLLQLSGLLHSRRGALAAAVDLLEPLYRRRPDDEETAGILAGVYKRRAVDTGDATWLKKAHRTYVRGWTSSRRQNTYLGLNAAATALLLGDPEKARSLGAAVSDLLEEREARLRRASHGAARRPYYLLASVAEAHLLAGRRSEALSTYRRAFHDHPTRGDDIAGTRAQADAILLEQGCRETLASLLAEGA